MTSLLDILHQALGDIQSTRYAFLASSSIIVFDHLITLGLEVDLIWNKKWSFGKVMFILNRYYPLISVIFNTYALFSSHLTDKVSSSNLTIYKCLVSLASKFTSCRHFVTWQGWTGLIACMLAEIILQTRLYALYSLNNRILALMVSMFLISSGLSAAVMGKILTDMRVTAKHLENVTFCVPDNISPKFFLFWVPLLIYESLLCGLALYKGYQSFKAGAGTLRSGSQLFNILVRDSVLYFIIIASAYFACLLLWILARQSLLEIPIGFTVAMSCVLANRVVLNVRDANRSPEDIEIRSLQVMVDENGVRSHLSDVEMDGLRSLRFQIERKFVVLK